MRESYKKVAIEADEHRILEALKDLTVSVRKLSDTEDVLTGEKNSDYTKRLREAFLQENKAIEALYQSNDFGTIGLPPNEQRGITKFIKNEINGEKSIRDCARTVLRNLDILLKLKSTSSEDSEEFKNAEKYEQMRTKFPKYYISPDQRSEQVTKIKEETSKFLEEPTDLNQLYSLMKNVEDGVQKLELSFKPNSENYWNNYDGIENNDSAYEEGHKKNLLLALKALKENLSWLSSQLYPLQNKN